MSTRGWYEYYVVDEGARQLSLAMQSYKWGDARPENALAELERLRAITKDLNGNLPVQHVRELLRDNLGAAYEQLPDSFLIGCHYFLMQRAVEEVEGLFRDLRFAGLPRKERPEYRLGYDVGKAMAVRGIEFPEYDDPVLERLSFFVQVGRLVRRWRECSTSMTFLTWLQYITQLTTETDMGCIAGHYEEPFDVSYVYRFFFSVGAIVDEDQPIRSIRLELCSRHGAPLLEDLRIAKGDGRGDRAYLAAEYETLQKAMAEAGYEPVCLDELEKTHAPVSSPFWDRRLPRNDYLGP